MALAASVRIGTAESDSTFLSQGQALRVVLERHPALAPVEVSTSAHASVENANRLDAGEIDFGFMAANWIGRAKHGEAPFPRAIDLRMVAPMNAGPLFFIVRADSTLRSVADLRGRRVAVGAARSGMAQHARLMFGSLGFDYSDFTALHLDFAAGADALARGEIDAQLQCPIPNKVMTALAERAPVRALAYPPGALEKLLADVPVYRRTVMRKGAFRGLEADLPQPAVLNVLVTHARSAAAKVGAVAAAIFTAREELPRLNPLFTGLDELYAPLRRDGAKALAFGGVTLHEGAVAAYREAGLLSSQ